MVLFLGPLANRAPQDEWRFRPDISPTDVELARALAERHGFHVETSTPLQLLETASYIQEIYGRDQLINDLRELLAGNYEPHGLYAYLASIPTPLVIVTTNYDDLIEETFIKAHHPFHRISMIASRYDLRSLSSWRREEITDPVLWWKSNAAESEAVPLSSLHINPNQTTVIIKLRGTLDCRQCSPGDRQDSFVITEDDYLNLLTRLSNQKSLPPFASYFRESNYLFTGFGLPSWNLRVLLKSLISIWGSDVEHRRRTWIFEPRPTEYAVNYWRNRYAKIYDEVFEDVTDNLAHQESKIIDGAISRMNSGTEAASPTVFISYAREDAAQARAVYKALKARGFNPWRDKEKILPGEEWDLKIKRSLKESDFLLMCLSSKSLKKRGYVQKEIRMALDVAQEFPPGSIFLIPVRFDECEMPDELTRYQYVDWFSPDGPEQVIRSIAIGWRRRNM